MIASLDLGVHLGDVRRREIVSSGCSDGGQFAHSIVRGSLGACSPQGLPYPFGNREPLFPSDLAKLLEFFVVENHLEPLTHLSSMTYSWDEQIIGVSYDAAWGQFSARPLSCLTNRERPCRRTPK